MTPVAEFKPNLIVIAGPNGSGKTSVTEQLLQHAWSRDCHYINPDIIAQQEFGDWNSPRETLRAAQRAEVLRNECLDHRQSLLFETVFSSLEKPAFLQRAIASGYFIRFFFICTDDPSINCVRVLSRVREGGHGVPPEKIVSRYGKSISQCAASLRTVHRGYVYDNSVENAPPALLFRSENGLLKKLYREPVNRWASPILNALTSI